ncbi:exopolysaccharide biosynthesis protein [Terrihabitans rhizophilus]|uniref:Exopolysaccharide biosynthesis protein n=1 Tax=Terrihabitans rhizophilus TaxID=3092662 RepID=A0ABU4RNQ4_9HYPH|nr:exopolysaccharide biosynthesis protein [Terrihabitans sp. PJ23]MDX6806468.1 exopolysaccharide biosynthesis protein [Terrihabitans sp. PJ23]
MSTEGSTIPARRFARLRRPRRKRVTATKMSEVLLELARDESHDEVSVRDLLVAMRHRAIGALMLVFAFPNILPTPPGTSSVLGAPLVFLAAQMMLGRPPWLPRFITRRALSRSDFSKFAEKAAPWLGKAERLLRPRLPVLTGPPFEYVVGGISLLLSIILLLPIPLGNMPPALAIVLFALGTLERDGVWIIAGLVTSVVSVFIVSGVLYAMVQSCWYLLTGYLGF